MLVWLRRLFRRRKGPSLPLDTPRELIPMDFSIAWYSGSEETVPPLSRKFCTRGDPGLCPYLTERRVSGK